MSRSLHAAVVGAATLALLGVPGPAVARGSLECNASMLGVTARGVPTTFRFEDGAATTEKRGPDSLGYQPRDLAFPHHVDGQGSSRSAAGTGAATSKSYWFTLSGSQLREVVEVDRRDTQGRLVSAQYHTRIVGKHWEGARQISIGRNRAHLYVLTNTDQLVRYRLRGKDGNVTVKYDQVVGVGFGAIGTFEYTRTITALGARIDVFLATDADSGALLEYAIPKDAPTSYATRVLAETGWTDMRSAGRRASCLDPKSGDSYDAIVAMGLDGAIRLWTDRDGNDGDGQDIVEWGVLKSSWKPMAYSD